MNTAAKLSAYGAVLAVVGVVGWTVGSSVGPLDAAPVADEHGGHSDTDEQATAAEALPSGLTSSKNGYTVAPVATALPTGPSREYAFRITGPDGAAVTAFDVAHDKRMHLIAVRRDTAGFQHVHPEMAADGTWRVPLDLTLPGSYRVYADFAPTGGADLTLGVDLDVAGDYQPETFAPSRVAQVDGYEVRLDGELVPGQSSAVTLTVSRDGKPVTDLQPYLGAYGHLVTLRGGDLAYLHVHPDGEPGDGRTAAGPQVVFYAEVPSTAGYRLFFDFQHNGEVRTAEFTVDSAGAPAPQPANPSAPATTTEPEHADDGH